MRVDTIFWASSIASDRLLQRSVHMLLRARLAPTVNDGVFQLTLCTWLYPHVSEKTADFGDLSRNMPYCQCTLPYGDCKAIMHVGSLPNYGELFTDFWHPQRLVDMKSMKVGSGRLPGGNLNIQAGSPCKGPPPIFWGLSCEHPWALAQDFTVLWIVSLSRQFAETVTSEWALENTQWRFCELTT